MVEAPSAKTTPTESLTRIGRVRITPLAKRIAKDNNLDYTKLAGTGPHGLIVADDVRQSLSAAPAKPTLAPATPAPAITSPPPAAASPAQVGKATISTGFKWEDIHIGIATSIDDGLVVPVLEHADWLSLAQIPRQTRRLFNLAKESKQASLAPSRFTVSNLGMFNVDSFTAIINPPEVAILAVASIEKRVMPPKGEQLGVRLRDMMSMTISLDHRAGDGVLAARFVNRVRELLETPQLLE